jgi:tRNA 2-thiouridine synthesizing protein E
MPDYVVEGRSYLVDTEGFLQNWEKWNVEAAKDLALTESITNLTDDHWKLINYIRKYYDQYGTAPMIRKVTRETGFNLEKIYELFPSGPAKGACKVAGLPKPAGCV